ncbi:hypothetical protein Sjap_020106 [Stephania japonica]|uniref:Uncharacterized protein n=1 Tax=Stephania japonica TaxID=461633 RepID=A0AAP0HYQ7_9MAGN
MDLWIQRLHYLPHRFMLQGRRIASISYEIVIFKKKLKRKFASPHLIEILLIIPFLKSIFHKTSQLCFSGKAEKIEQMELDFESKGKITTTNGTKELCNAQLLLTAELSEKLEKAQKKLENTEQVLFDLEA